MPRVIFEGETVDELVRKCRIFIGVNSPSTMTVGTSRAANTWPVPAWAPKGSKWFMRTSPPTLLGPDANEIAVRWVAGTAQRAYPAKLI